MNISLIPPLQEPGDLSTILGLELGKFKSLACLDDTDVTRFAPVPTNPHSLRKFLEAERP